MSMKYIKAKVKGRVWHAYADTQHRRAERADKVIFDYDEIRTLCHPNAGWLSDAVEVQSFSEPPAPLCRICAHELREA